MYFCTPNTKISSSQRFSLPFPLYDYYAQNKPDVDIVSDLRKLFWKPGDSAFIQSLLLQYRNARLSKKQLEGLYHKAAKITTIPGNKLTTEAIIKENHRYKSVLPPPAPLYTKDESAGRMLETILEKYPQHKRILFLKAKYDNNETLSVMELSELQKFNKMLH